MATREKTKKNIIELNPKYEVDFDSEVTKNGVKYFSVCCKDCSSIFQRTLSTLTEKGLKNTCETCLNMTRREVIDKKGYDFLGAVKGKYFIMCRKCNSYLIKPYCVMTSKTIICDVCKVNSVSKKLSDNGCEFVDLYSKDSDRRVVFTDKDGVLRDKKLTSLNVEGFRGGTRQGNYNVYIFWSNILNEEVISDGLYFKIGIAKSPSKRLKDLKLDYPFKIHIWKTFNTHKEAHSEEKRLHNLFWWCKLDKTIPQIFTNKRCCSKKNKLGKRSWAKDGVTEWFYIPEELFNFMLRNKESFSEYNFTE